MQNATRKSTSGGKESGKAVRIAQSLLGEIRDRVYADGNFPSENELAERFGAARETIRKAVDVLVCDGIVRRVKGCGTFLTGRAERKTGLVGLIVPDATSAEIFSEFIHQIDAIASRNGYKLAVANLERRGDVGAGVRRAARELAVRRVEGVIYRPLIDERFANSNLEVVRIFKNAEIPVVLLDSDVVQPPERSEYDLVNIDNIAAGRRIADHLLACGRRRIAFLMGGKSFGANANWRNRLFGLAGELALNGAENAVKVLDFAPDNAAAVEKLRRSRQRPDAIVCGNDDTAALLVKTLVSAGLRVPDDVAVVGFDDAPSARFSVPPLTTIRQPAREIALSALRLLLARIRHPSAEPTELHLPAPLVVRRSTQAVQIAT